MAGGIAGIGGGKGVKRGDEGDTEDEVTKRRSDEKLGVV